MTRSPLPPLFTVLVVDDDDLFREMTVKLLQRPERAVIAAPDAATALALVRRHGAPIDLLVTDLVLDEGGGLLLARTLAGRYPGLQTLFMSGQGQDTTGLVEARNRTFIEKPISSAALEQAVEALLGPRG
jgi:DNA-binding NtrC family response regulator